MADTDYIFHISPYDTEKLLPQVSRALEKRTEMVSRERFPGLWKHTDRFRSMARGRKRSRLRTRGMSALCLAAGIFLAVPGLMEPRELFVPLLVGAAAMGAGIIGLWQSRARKKNPFDRAAKILLEGKDKSSAEQAASVSFSEEGMTVPAGSFLFVFGGRVLLLQKMDLKAECIGDFCSLISEKVKPYHSIA